MEIISDRGSMVHEKGWGREVVFASWKEYCGKFLIFDKAGSKFSMHCHREKQETWFVLQGSFRLVTINSDVKLDTRLLEVGMVHHIFPMDFHQLIALEPNSIIVEVSTQDNDGDNYRVMKGDSQNEALNKTR